MHRPFALAVLLLVAGQGLAQSTDGFLDVFDKLAKEKGVAIPTTIEKKAFEFVPIVKKAPMMKSLFMKLR